MRWMTAPFLASVFIACIFLASCGFRPLYSNVNTLDNGSSILDDVAITTSGSRLPSQQLKNDLVDRFYNHGYPENPSYALSVRLRQTTRDIVIRKDDVTSRAQIVMIANYTLTDRKTRQVISRGAVRSVGSYNILGSQYANIVTRDKARDWAIKELADKMALRVSVLLTDYQK